MSYQDTNCACGRRKLTDTLLCYACLQAFGGREEAAVYEDPQSPREQRRTAAIRLLAMARRRHA